MWTLPSASMPFVDNSFPTVRSRDVLASLPLKGTEGVYTSSTEDEKANQGYNQYFHFSSPFKEV
jgi:hypothetical protein